MQRHIKLLVVSHTGEVWGAQRRLLDLRPRLAERDIESVLACPLHSNLADRWPDDGRHLVAFETVGALGLREADGSRPGPAALARQTRVIASNARRIAKLVRATGADAVQSHDLNANVEVALAGRGTRRASIIDLHDVVAPGIGRRVLSVATRLASVTIANSRATAATVGAGRVEVVNPGVDLTRFFPGATDPQVRAHLAAHPDRPIVGILGRVDKQKGVDTLVRAMAALTGDAAHAQLAVVGAPLMTGDFGARVRAEAASLLGERVRFVEPTDDVPQAMRALDVLVNVSWFEPFGRTVLEGQACGVAVIGTDAGGIPEFVTDGVNGLLVPPEDEMALAAQLQRVLGDDALRARLGAEGARDASNISTERQADLVAAIIRSVVSN